MRCEAELQGKDLEELVAQAVAGKTEVRARIVPSPEERRRVLDKLWDWIDACNVEVGERPTRARTYAPTTRSPFSPEARPPATSSQSL